MSKSRQKKLDKMDVIELVISYDEPLTKPLNIKMERGQKLALVGSNGLGKSTLLKSLMGLIKPMSGEVEFVKN